MITYRSTRSDQVRVTHSQAILQGLSPDGGLFVPEHIPALETNLSDLKNMTYQEIAYTVMQPYLTDYTEAELKTCIANAYDDKFDTKAIAPLVKAGDTYYLELFHGATIAFKDMALSILPHLMKVAAKKNNLTEEIVILTATSGDTGKAALSGFADVPGIKIIVFYPKDGVSSIQERQMVTQKGENTHVVGIHGNFDDAQTGVKKIFNDQEIQTTLKEKGYVFSSANSINIGRLVPQIAYYVYAYAQLLKEGAISEGEEINVVVPTGNFGNILAAYYAKEMGLPLAKLICASNENKVLYDFLISGTYDKNRDFVLTSSPSMDILISSNLERLIYHIAGDDAELCGELMAALGNEGRYAITPYMKELLSDFHGGYATEAETSETIKRVFNETGYVLDPHTAVADFVYHNYRQTGCEKKAVVVATASPYKFLHSVIAATTDESLEQDDFELIDKLHEISGVAIPAAIEEIRTEPIKHRTVCEIKEMPQIVYNFLEI
jgi:threonine synthase